MQVRCSKFLKETSKSLQTKSMVEHSIKCWYKRMVYDKPAQL